MSSTKNSSWYFLLAIAAVVVAALFYLITRDLISSVVVIVGAIALGVYGARPPRQITYQLDNRGLSIGTRLFAYNEFRSFAIVPEGAFNSIILVHHKRFAPLTTVYPAPDQEEAIINVIANHLPLEEHKLDAVEHLMRRIRF